MFRNILKKRQHNYNDLFLGCFSLSIVIFCIIFSIYGQSTLRGFSNDIHTFSPIVQNLLHFPSDFIFFLISFILPLCAGIFLITKKLWIDLVFTICLSYFTYVLVSLLSFLPPHFFMAPYSTVTCILTLSGSFHKDRIIKRFWQFYFSALLLLIIFNPEDTGQIITSLFFGIFVGMLFRYIIGTNFQPVTKTDIENLLSELGYNIKRIEESPTIANLQRKIYKVILSDNSTKQLEILDSHNKIYHSSWKLKGFLTFKEVNYHKQTFRDLVEHSSLMYYAFSSSGNNCLKLENTSFIRESAVFVFDSISDITYLSDEIKTDNQMQIIIDSYWEELNLAHSKGIVFRQINPTDLTIYNEKAMISGIETGEIIGSSFFKIYDISALLKSLSLVIGEKNAYESYIKQLHSSSLSKGEQALQIQSVLALIKTHKFPILSEALKKYFETNFEEKPVNLINDHYRWTPKTVISLSLTVIAVMVLLTQFDFESVRYAITESNHAWTAFGLILSFVTFVGSSLVIIAFSEHKLNFSEVLKVQIASGYYQISLPLGTAPIITNLQYLNNNFPKVGQKSAKIKNTATLALWQISQITGIIILMLFFASVNHSFLLVNRNNSGLPIAVFIFIVAIVGFILYIIPKTRKVIFTRLIDWGRGFIKDIVIVVKEPKKLLIGYCGVFLQALGYSLCYWACLEAFGQKIEVTKVILVFLLANSAGGIIPTPGGLGSVETALTLGFTTMGIPPTIAVSATLLYRLITLWLRAPLGALFKKTIEAKYETK